MSAGTHSEIIVVGLGATGSLTLLELARRGVRVAGLDRGHPPHDLGSSHGRSRIIREAYFEDPLYVPLVRRAYEGWQTLEADAGASLLRVTGGLCLGPATSALVAGATASALQHSLAFERLDADTIRRRFPAHAIPDAWVGIHEPRAGMLDPERCIATALRVATAQGANAHLGETVTGWTEHPSHVEVRTDRGVHRADRVILSAGMWMRHLVPALRPHLTIERQVQFWFAPRSAASHFDANHFPVFLSEVTPGRIWYGFPDVGDGVKVAWHHGAPHDATAEVADDAEGAPALHRTVSSAEVDAMRAHLATHLPEAEGTLRSTAVCTYTNTRDEHFLIDRAPDSTRIWLASPCSGHGFKFAPALGEVLADLVLGETPAFDVTPFRWDRLDGARE